MDFKRSSGILLHVSSLPGTDGIGDLGKGAYDFIDFLSATNTHLWQVLPLNPTGYGNSPYQGLSASAGNPLLISLDSLVELGLLEKHALRDRPHFPKDKVDFELVSQWKMAMLHLAYQQFLLLEKNSLIEEYQQFCHQSKEWLNDFALFMAIRNKNDLRSWDSWDEGLRFRKKDAIAAFTKKNEKEINEYKFFQFLFFKQWKEVKDYANQHEIQIIGDIPIFVGYDCADTWTNPDLFFFDVALKPTVVAGVPPDFFSKTGQLWGNPLYDWKQHKKKKYAWWIARIQNTLDMVDIIRLDHFRGFAGYYEIPASAKTAETGQWVPGPGFDLFDAFYDHFGELPFIAEDLGVVTDDVIALRERYHLPGMKIVQFGFNPNPEWGFIPHNIETNAVAYTGTHDNATTAGWYKALPKEAKKRFLDYCGKMRESVPAAMIRLLWMSSAIFAIAPMQDLLNLGDSARMNYPGTVGSNWEWRMKDNWNSPRLQEWVRQINQLYERG